MVSVSIVISILLCGVPESDEMIYHEPYRPQFHFTPRQNWMNDPNGLVYYKGEYHLFYQYNPAGTAWGNICWGHAVSTDLIHWKELPIALFPDKNGMCFSGSAFVDWKNAAGLQRGKEPVMTALYTGAMDPGIPNARPFGQCLAYSSDRGCTWRRFDKNPVLPHVVALNRDPKVFWHEPSKQFVMALYLDKNEYGFFGSENLREWTALSQITLPGSTECPDFFELPVEGEPSETRWIFVGGDGAYRIGAFDGRTFVPETERLRYEYGSHFYATQTFNDIPAKDGRRIQLAWMSVGQYPGMPFSQQLSFPCVLTLKRYPEGLRLCRMPVREIRKLFQTPIKWRKKLFQGTKEICSGIDGLALYAEIEPGDSPDFGFSVHGQEISYSASKKTLSCLGKDAPIELESGRIPLVVLVDRTSMEVFINNGKAILSCCYLAEAGKDALEIFTTGKIKFVSIEVFPLKSAWEGK